MNRLTGVEKKRLLSATKRIYEHKLVLISGFWNLVEKARNERLKTFVRRVCDEEVKNAEFWSRRIEALLGRRSPEKEYLRVWKTRLIMAILGTKGIFEWAVLGEELSIQDLAIQAGQIQDHNVSKEWSGYASDERVHLERMKTEVLGMETWEVRGGGGVRDMIFGANDGLVSTLAFIAGVVGAIADPFIVLLSGIAELFAGTISMAAGSYQSAKSELEVWGRESRNQIVQEGPIERGKKELIKVYEARFYPGVHADILEELGLTPKELGNPLKSGVLCGMSFGLAALIPIFPFAFPILSCQAAFIASIIATVTALFGVGAMKTIFSRKNWIRSGFEMMIIGAGAATVTYMIGKVFSLLFNV